MDEAMRRAGGHQPESSDARAPATPEGGRGSDVAGAAPLHELLEHGDALVELSASWVVVRVNAAQERLTGKRRTETLGRVFWDIWPDAIHTRAWPEYHRCMEDRVSVVFQDYFEPLAVWFDITAYPTSTGGMAVFFRDVTARKRAEEDVQQREERLRLMFDNMSEGIMLFDVAGDTVYQNPAALRIHGVTGSDGRFTHRDLPVTWRGWSPDGSPLPFDGWPLSRVLRGEQFQHQVLHAERVETGYSFDASYNGCPIRDADGKLVYGFITIRDITEQVRTTKALQESEERLRLAQQAARIGSFEFYPRTNASSWSPELEALHGLPPGGYRGAHEHWASLVHPDDLTRVEQDLRQAMETGAFEAEWRVVWPDETVHWVAGRGRVFKDEQGRPTRMVGVNLDITDLKRSEEALARSEAKFRSVFEQAAIGIGRVRFSDARWIDVNDAFCRMLGRTREEMQRTPWPEMTHPDDVELDLVPFRRMAAGELASYSVEKRFLHADGRHVWAKLTLSLVRDGSGRPEYEIAIIEDIGERKQVQQALLESEERHRTVLENMAEGLVLFDPTGNITYQNPASVRIHTRQLSGDRRRLDHLVVNWNVRTYPEGDVVPPEGWAIPRVLRGERVHNERFFVDCIEDPERSFVGIYNGAPVLEADGALAYGFLTIEEITDQARAETAVRHANERLREEDRRKNEFLGMLSHELRNPLAPIRNALFILDHAEPSGHQARRAKEIARRQVTHMTRLVDDLLDVTRIARGKIELRRTALDLSALASRTVDDHRPLMQGRGLDLELILPPTPVLVNGDETRLAQVLGNLLHNASKFTPAGGRVTLALEHDGSEAIVHVRDTGVGMDAETMRTIFEPFVQARQSIARSEGGLGLGLALVKGLVTMHGGDVTARSAGQGRGTEFTVTLPLDRRQMIAARPPPEGERSGAARRRILVVDDNRDAAESLAELLEMSGHEVAVAHDGPGAVASALANRPEVILCDIGLPGMDGYEVARRVRASGAGEIRLVAVSGYAQPEDVARATEAGFDAHVAKPPDPERLASLLA